jgi:hypothetical protein
MCRPNTNQKEKKMSEEIWDADTEEHDEDEVDEPFYQGVQVIVRARNDNPVLVENPPVFSVPNLRNAPNVPVEDEDQDLPDEWLCPICYESYDDASRLPVSGKCGHVLCNICILKMDNGCPFCRGNVNEFLPHTETLKQFEGWGKYVLAMAGKLERLQSTNIKEMEDCLREKDIMLQNLQANYSELRKQYNDTQRAYNQMYARFKKIEIDHDQQTRNLVTRVSDLSEKLAYERIERNQFKLTDQGVVVDDNIFTDEKLVAIARRKRQCPTVSQFQQGAKALGDDLYAIESGSWAGYQVGSESLYKDPVYIVNRTEYKRLLDVVMTKRPKKKKRVTLRARITRSRKPTCDMCSIESAGTCTKCKITFCVDCLTTKHRCEKASLFDN